MTDPLQQATRSRDVSFVVAITCCLIAMALDVWAHNWTTLALVGVMLFVVVSARYAMAPLDRLFTAKIATAEAERQIAETTYAHLKDAMAAGRVHVNVEPPQTH